jgi:hypothetical protein
MKGGKMQQEIITSYPMNPNGGINLVLSELPNQDFFSIAASQLLKRDALESQLRELDRNISGIGREFGDRLKMWGMNPTILRRELRLRGYGV